MIGMLLIVGVMLGVPLSVIAWWWIADNAHQDLDLRLKHIAGELIQMEGPGGELDPAALTSSRLGLLMPDGGQLRITHHVPARAQSGAAPAMITTRLGTPVDGREFVDSITVSPPKPRRTPLELDEQQLRAIAPPKPTRAAALVPGTAASGPARSYPPLETVSR